MLILQHYMEKNKMSLFKMSVAPVCSAVVGSQSVWRGHSTQPNEVPLPFQKRWRHNLHSQPQQQVQIFVLPHLLPSMGLTSPSGILLSEEALNGKAAVASSMQSPRKSQAHFLPLLVCHQSNVSVTSWYF